MFLQSIRHVTFNINTAKDKTSSAATTSGTVKKAASSLHAASSSNATSLLKNSGPAALVVVLTNKKGKKRSLDDEDEGPEPEPARKKLWPRMRGVPKEDDTLDEAQVTSVCTMTLVKGPDGHARVQ
ncbi:hypothetical protein BDV93DRAFT_556886 [Ceratobasidium sp. AG-I]|nr:hypothetical protein BDV93DRAFT_556886 [Ceratobasidium sp. AG-I]